jgi:crotonobetainyl-CoA:carnitine CoA-transferase CaiB-like acyl-CoA transferase
MWSNSGDLVYSKGTGQDYSQRPLGSTYHRTADGRWVIVTMPDPTRWWKELSRRLGREELVDDPRFAIPEALAANREALASELRAGFGSFTLDELRERLGAESPWEPVQNLLEVAEDPQVVSNEYFADIQQPAGDAVSVVRAPVQFDEDVSRLRPAPRLGQDSRQVLADLGYDEVRVAALVSDGVVG